MREPSEAPRVSIKGEVLGERAPAGPGFATELVVRVTASDEAGPAANSIVMVARDGGGLRRARYISWIGYADLDHANSREFGRWRLVEPPEPYRSDVAWQAFGWGPLEDVWTRPPSEGHPESERRHW
jgi:hypothetical protein